MVPMKGVEELKHLALTNVSCRTDYTSLGMSSDGPVAQLDPPGSESTNSMLGARPAGEARTF
jgi:hypothetical protein